MAKTLHVIDQRLDDIPREKEGLRLWLRIVACTQMVEQEIRNMLREKHDMTLPRFELLAALDRVPDGLTMGELSRWLMVTKGNVTGIAERLSEAGYVTREPTPTDRRSFVVKLTAQGRQVFKEVEADYEALLDALFGELTPDDSDYFAGMLWKVREAIETLHTEPGS